MANYSFEEMTDFIVQTSHFEERFFRMVPPCEWSTKLSGEELTLDEKDFALSLQPSLPACKDGPRFDIEPYYPHQFACQFGFDQDVPAHLPRIPRYQSEIGAGPLHWLAVCSRFEGVKFSCELQFPSSDCAV